MAMFDGIASIMANISCMHMLFPIATKECRGDANMSTFIANPKKNTEFHHRAPRGELL